MADEHDELHEPRAAHRDGRIDTGTFQEADVQRHRAHGGGGEQAGASDGVLGQGGPEQADLGDDEPDAGHAGPEEGEEREPQGERCPGPVHARELGEVDLGELGGDEVDGHRPAHRQSLELDLLHLGVGRGDVDDLGTQIVQQPLVLLEQRPCGPRQRDALQQGEGVDHRVRTEDVDR